MKHIGLVGGLSPSSTVHYYERLCSHYNERFGELNFPEISLRSINLQRLAPLFQRNDWDGVARVLLEAIGDLKRAGAEFAAILANTPHNAYELIRDESPLKIVTIMEAAAEALRGDGRNKPGLLGTRPTMEFGFFERHFQDYGIELLTPPAPERKELDRIIWEELARGEVRAESRNAVQRMMAGLADQGADAILLGCTELELVVERGDSPRPLYDTAAMHADAILDYALR
jgi:aspartate racemase